jgi:hypothetical protein
MAPLPKSPIFSSIWNFEQAQGVPPVSQQQKYARLATAKIRSNGRIDVDRHWLRAVFGGGKTFSHGLGQKRTSDPWLDGMISACVTSDEYASS